MDDGSTDNSLKVLEPFNDCVKVLNSGHCGQAAAMNMGFAVAQGEIVMFLDADDMLESSAIKEIVNSFSICSDLAKVQFRLEIVDINGVQQGILAPPAQIRMQTMDLRDKPFDLRHYSWTPTSGNAYPKWLITLLTPIPEKLYRIGADGWVNELAPIFGPLKGMDKVLGYYRIHGQNNFLGKGPTFERLQQDVKITFERRKLQRECMATLGLSPERIEEVAGVRMPDLQSRLISLVVNPTGHPINGDTPIKLVKNGLSLSLQSSTWHRKIRYASWFLTWAVLSRVPSPLARRVGLKWMDAELQSPFIKNLKAQWYKVKVSYTSRR